MAEQDPDSIVRCPYCVSGLEFKAMVGHLDGRFICRKCGHTARPDKPEYRCGCSACRKTFGGPEQNGSR